jgi:hypothetical protein
MTHGPYWLSFPEIIGKKQTVFCLKKKKKRKKEINK